MRTIKLGLLNDSINEIFISSIVYEKENEASTIEVTIPTELQGYKYKLVFRLPDNSVVVTSELIPVENVIEYKIGSNLTSKIGKLVFEFHIYNDAGLLCKIGKYMLNVQDAIDIPTP